MSDPFDSAKRCLSWGKKHVGDFKSRVWDFIETKPQTTVVEYDSQGICEYHKIKMVRSLPDELANIVSDAVQNLRQALDQACFVLGQFSSITNPRNTKFPFADNDPEFKGRLAKKDFPNDIKPLLASFKPYKGGNDFLWALNRVCNTNKHDYLIPALVGCRGTKSLPPEAINNPDFPLGWHRSHNEFIFAIVRGDKILEYDGELTFAVTFGEIEVVKGQPVVIILNEFVTIVERILLAIEAEARRLGYI